MNAPYRTVFSASLIVLALVALCGIAAAASPAPQEIVDARLESQIMTTYALSPYLRANKLHVSVKNGKATLTGTVDEEVNKELAKVIALGADGISDVENKIVVQANFVPPKSSSARGYGEFVDDATITALIKSKLMWSKYTDGLSTTVETTNGKVKLVGVADSETSKAFAGRLAMNTRGVVAVDNQLAIDSKKPAKVAAETVGTDISDGWITTKVKSTFMYSSNVASTDIAVSTNGGVVTLTGKVSSGAERALAIELAQNIRGVNSVNAKELTF